MTKTLTLLLASAALTAAVGLPAWSAMHGQGPLSDLLASGAGSARLLLVDDEHEDEGGSVTSRQHEDDDEGECEDDDGNCGAAAAPAPAPAGTVPPPQNGLFGTGTPKVQVK